ncbi:MAG TPA: outer membrane beta-barrel protein [Rhodothermales bacterium]|nr:outer membrane beta-barrel protein [Rhodothermales bacterium]
MRASLLSLALLAALAAPAASAQIRFLPYIGYNLSAGIDPEATGTELESAGGFLVGVGVEFGFAPPMLPVAIKIRPSVETVFLPGGNLGDLGGIQRSGAVAEPGDISQSYFQGNLDLIGEFSPPLAPVAAYVGVGAAYGSYSLEIEDVGDADDTAFGVNFLAGVRGRGFIAPFLQARYTMMSLDPGESDDDDDDVNQGLSIMAGASIGL